MTVETVELEIQGIAAGGDGVGRADGLVVFAPRTAPGDRVRATIERGRRFARASHSEILVASPDRVVPMCPHYDGDACGGCQLQHLSDEAQRRAKAAMIRDALVRIARRPADLPEVRHGRSPWRYRSKLTLALRRTAGGWVAGLHRYDDPAAIFALMVCPITDPRVLEIWHNLLAHADLLPDAPSLRGSVRLLGDGASFVLEGGTTWHRAPDVLEAVAGLRSIWWSPEGARPTARRLAASRQPGQEHGASFMQVNAEVAEMMRAHVLGIVRSRAPRRVVDAYAGVGDTAEPIARAGANVVAIEADGEACQVCSARLPVGSRAVADTVERALAALLPADLVILNPPRTGIAGSVAAVLEAAAPQVPTIIYVSCDPATLARDIGRLPSYGLAGVTAFDMFPQTAHVETVCDLRLAGAAA